MKNHQLQLIENTYKLEDAKEVLFSLVNDKMEFLKLQIMSKTERFGTCSADFSERLEALRAEKQNLQKLFKQYEGQEDVHFEIDCLVDIKVKKEVAETI